jgi:hypothetical protein
MSRPLLAAVKAMPGRFASTSPTTFTAAFPHDHSEPIEQRVGTSIELAALLSDVAGGFTAPPASRG